MTRRIFLFVLLTLIALLGSNRAQAAGLPGKLYFDTTLTTNGTGTMSSPYNNLTDAINKARSLSGGAKIYERQNGVWGYWGYVSGTVSGPTGLPLPEVTLYILLAVAALVMAIAGLRLRRRSRQLQH